MKSDCRKKNILVCTMDFPPDKGGMEICAYEISRQLARYYTVTVAAARTAPCDYHTNSLEIINFILPRAFFPKIIRIFFFIVRLVLNRQIDILYLNTWSPFGLPALALKIIFGIPYCITAHGLDIVEPISSRFHSLCMNIVLHNASYIFTVSGYTRSLVQRFVKYYAGNAVVIPNGVDYRRFAAAGRDNRMRNRYGLGDTFVLLTVSRLVPRKGHRTVIQCLEILRRQKYPVTYLIVGEGETRAEIEKDIERRNLRKHVIVAGLVAEEDLPAVYAESDLFIMPSKELLASGDVEGFGVAFLEANAAGVPVIGPNTAGCAEAIVDGVTGFLADPEDTDTLVALIEKLINNPDERRKLGSQGRKRVETSLNWENNVQKMMVYLERACR